MLVAVTGASGFVGQHLVRHLVQEGHEVRGLSRGAEGEARIAAAGGQPHRGDVLVPEDLRGLVRGCDAVVHLVAIIRERGDQTFDRVIRQGTENALQAAQDEGVRRFLHQSALGAVDEAGYPYLQAKARAEQAVQRSSLDWTILRPSLLAGEGDHVFTLLAGMARTQPFMPVIGRGDMKLQPLAIDDLVRIVQRCLEDPATVRRVYELGGPEHVRYEDMLKAVLEASGQHRPLLHMPVGLMKLAVRGMAWTMRDPPITPDELDILLRGDNVTDLDSVRGPFGFEPKTLRESLAYLQGSHAASEVGPGSLPRAGGTPRGKEPGRPGMRGPA